MRFGYNYTTDYAVIPVLWIRIHWWWYTRSSISVTIYMAPL